MAIKKKQYQAELSQYYDTYKRAKNKYQRQLRKDPEIRPETFGLSSKMFEELKPDTKAGNISIKQIRQKTAMLEEFTDRQYGLKKIGTKIESGKVKNVYMAKNEYRMAYENLKAENKYRATLSKAIERAGGYEYKRLTKHGLVTEKSNLYNATVTKSNDLIPVKINIVGGKTIGYTGKLTSREITLAPENFKKKYGVYTNKAKDTENIRTKNLMKNWLKGLGNNVSEEFKNEIKNKLRSLGVDYIDFMALFYLTGVFDFDFIYDEVVAISSKKDEIESEIDALRSDKKRYERFRADMASVTPEFSEEELYS